MKTTITFLLFVVCTTISTQAQCFRQDAFEAIDDPAQYPVTGTAKLQFETDGTKQVIFEDDFSTVQGLELRVYLSSTPRLNQGGDELEVTTEPLQDDNGGMDTNDPITGLKVFDIASDIALSDYDYILIQCVMADVLWGRSDLGANEGPDCSTLSAEGLTQRPLTIYPNPTRNNFTLQGNEGAATITIFDTLGKEILHTRVDGQEAVNVSRLNRGLYLLKIRTLGRIETQKLIIQ